MIHRVVQVTREAVLNQQGCETQHLQQQSLHLIQTRKWILREGSKLNTKTFHNMVHETNQEILLHFHNLAFAQFSSQKRQKQNITVDALEITDFCANSLLSSSTPLVNFGFKSTYYFVQHILLRVKKTFISLDYPYVHIFVIR